MRRNKELTEEQKQQAEARKMKWRALVEKVAEMTPEQRQAITDRAGVVHNCEGRPLSNFNTCLLIQQREDVSIVGGFVQWREQDRAVNKGETGLMIWVPIRPKAGNREVEPGPEDKQKFLMRYVFDISQTSLLSALSAKAPEEASAEEALAEVA